ncbi:MAG TPA: DUF2339 domain-containing protein, partial [Thermoanaerobaculia bacterium]|nr:DUF2339 domain-containing protein [Thermoanaerobaculia bacterium]
VLFMALAFLTVIAPVQLDGEWISIAWAIEAAALAWLYTRVPHRGLLFWIGGLGVALLPMLRDHELPYALCAIAMFTVARFAPPVRVLAASLGTIELFVLLNVAIGNFYDRRIAASPLAQGLTYTIAWALFAIAMLVAGIVLRSRGARVAALGLLLVTVLKCFLYDLASLGGLYRVGSLFGLAVSLVLVGLMLQKFVMMRRVTSD